MRTLCIFLLAVSLALIARAEGEPAGHVFKVLPFFLDQQGQIAKSPSLFDRDAYQAELAMHTNLVSGIRYDVLWSAKNTGDAKLKLRLELRGLDAANQPKYKTLEVEVKPGFFRSWTEFPLTGDTYREFGGITAWRASLWDGDKMLSEQKSFLW